MLSELQQKMAEQLGLNESNFQQKEVSIEDRVEAIECVLLEMLLGESHG